MLPAAQNELSVVVVNGKGHLSSRLCWLAKKTEKGSEEGQINLCDREEVTYLERGMLVALYSAFVDFFYIWFEKS